MDYLMYLKTFLLWFDHFLDPWAEICQIFRCFLENLKNQKDILKLSDLYKHFWIHMTNVRYFFRVVAFILLTFFRVHRSVSFKD